MADVLAIYGVILLAVGLWQIWPPLAFLAIGALLVILALWMALRGG